MLTKIINMIALSISMMVLVSCKSAHVSESRVAEPGYICVAAAGDITVDGRLDESDWQNAEVVSTFYPYTPTTDPELSPTRVRLLWGDDYLYVAFECKDDDIWSFSDKDDDDLWNGDAVEFFIHADTFGLGYKEFVVSPSGALFDAYHASRGGGGGRRFKTWDADAEVATVINGTDGNWHDDDVSFTAELAIPIKSLGDIHQGAWSFGAFRYNYSKSFEEMQLLMSIPEAPKWGFHYYPGYRPLIFKRTESK